MSLGRRSGPSGEAPVQPHILDDQLALLRSDSSQPFLQEYAYATFGRGRPCQPELITRPQDRRAQWSPESYSASINQLFEATGANAEQALKDAAQEGKPVVMMFGSRNSRECQTMLTHMTQSENINYRGWMKLIYVDIDSVDPNSNIGRVVRQSFNGGQGSYRIPTTFLFTQHPDAAGNPVPDRPIVIQGAHSPAAFSKLLARDIPRLQEIQQGYNFRPQAPADNVPPAPMPPAPEVRPPAPEVRPPAPEVRPPAPPEVRPPEVRPPAPAGSGPVYDLHRDVFTNLQQAARATDPAERDRLYKAAITAADKVTPQMVMPEVQRLQRQFQELAASGASAQDARVVLQQIFSLRDLTQASGIARANLGLHKIKEGNPAEGMSYILEAGSRNPAMYNDNNFARALIRAGYPYESTLALIQAGRENPNFFLQSEAPAGRYNPGMFAPGRPQPGGYTPGMFAPGGPQPGGYHPGMFAPGGPQPGGYNPGMYAPGGPRPGGYTPGGMRPGAAYDSSTGTWRPEYGSSGGYNPSMFAPGGRPGTYSPGFTQPLGGPGTFNPGGYNPGRYNPGGYNPSTFNPGYGPVRGINPNSIRQTTRVIR